MSQILEELAMVDKKITAIIDDWLAKAYLKGQNQHRILLCQRSSCSENVYISETIWH